MRDTSGRGQFIKALQQGDWREALFLLSVWLKGLDGLLELIGGGALLSVSPGFILRLVQFLTHDEITEDPHDVVANALLRGAVHQSVATEHFMALYLLVHGVIKLGLVWALLERVLIAYPLAIVTFIGFIAYQSYRYTLTHSIGLVVFTALDVVLIVLITLEYRALSRHELRQ